jgi:soluble lytic murein transglycosylase
MKLKTKITILVAGALAALSASLTAFAVYSPQAPRAAANSTSIVKLARVESNVSAKTRRAAKKQPRREARKKPARKKTGNAKRPAPAAAGKKLPPPVVFAGGMALPERNPLRPASAATQAALDPAPPLPSRAPQRSKYADALAPLLDYKLSDSDKTNLKAAINAGYRKDFSGVMAAKARLQDAGARKLALWYAYRSGARGANGIEIERFRVGNPMWPAQDDLRENAEVSLFLRPQTADEVVAFFTAKVPETGPGKAALATALLEKGQKSRAKSLAASAWRDHIFGEDVEQEMLKRFAPLLSAEDHKVRVDRLLYADKKSRTAHALRIAKLLGADEQKKIAARVAVVERSAKAGKMLADLPEEQIRADVGLMFNRIQWLRRSDRESEAWEAMLAAPNEPEKLVDMNEWWTERRIHIRTALNKGQPFVAYNIAANHGPLSGFAYRDAEFMAGWIALRFLRRHDDAMAHFLALKSEADDPKWVATAAYWLGRTAQAMGEKDAAKKHFGEAAEHAQHYYGQLAAQEIAGGPTSLVVPPTPEATPADIQRFLSHDAVKAMGALRQAGLENLVPLFLYQLARSVEHPVDAVLTAETGLLFKQQQATVRLAKIAFNRGMPVAQYAFPSDVLPPFEKLNEGVDPALVHALTRQESEFNAMAKSPVGARGLMQFMPATARAVAKKYGQPYSEAKLHEAAYNVALGNAHLRDLVDDFNGSYILTLVAYNAGPGRSRQWSELYGAPTDAASDPIDWVERIPFYETREYVKKIMESMQVYRALLEGPQKALRLKEDLYRGHAASGAATASIE